MLRCHHKSSPKRAIYNLSRSSNGSRPLDCTLMVQRLGVEPADVCVNRHGFREYAYEGMLVIHDPVSQGLTTRRRVYGSLSVGIKVYPFLIRNTLAERIAMKIALVLAASATLLGANSAQAIRIHDFDLLDGDDQIDYVDQLAQSVEDAASNDPALLAKVKRFFRPKTADEDISGMGRFELNLSLARIADIDAVAKHPKARRLEVEDVMYTTLEHNGIKLPADFRPSAPNFEAAHPRQTLVMTKSLAEKALDQTRNWVSRLVPGEHDFRSSTLAGMAGFPSEGVAIGYFEALSSVHGKAPTTWNSGGDSGAPQPWWQQNGYNSYHEAAHAACIQSTTSANPTWCN